MKAPKKLITNRHRSDLWKNVSLIYDKVSKVLPLSKAYMMGSFTTVKKRPADVDFILMLKTKTKTNAKWSLDLVIVPDNAHGRTVVADTKKWMRQKYGKKNIISENGVLK